MALFGARSKAPAAGRPAGGRLGLPLLGAALWAGAGAAAAAAVLLAAALVEAQERGAQAVLGEAAARAHAGAVAAFLDGPRRTLEAVAARAEVAAALAGDAAAREAMARRLAAAFPGARVRLLPAGWDRLEEEASPPFGFADLELVRSLERGGPLPPVEVYLPGRPGAHFDLARAVPAPGGGVAGVVLAAYPQEALAAFLGRLETPGGRLELHQRGVGALAARGQAAGGAVFRAPVAGTGWEVVLQTPAVASAGPVRPLVLGVAGGAVAVIALVVFALLRVLAGAMRRDQVTILNLVRDLLARRLGTDYPVRLASSAVTVSLLIDMGREMAARTPAPAARPVPEPKPAAPAVEEVAPAAVAVEEEVAPVFGEASEAEGGSLERVPASIFRAYDIRGVVGETLTPEIVEAIGRALGTEAYERGQQSLVVGRDGRLSGPELAEALMRGIQASGRDVVDIGMVPTPVLYFATHYLGTGSGVAVTGSHNPPNYNGLKIMLAEETLSGEAIQALRARIESGDLLAGSGARERREVIDDYIDRIVGDVRPARPLRVVVDCGNGVAGAVAPRLLRELGCEVTELYCEVDGRFPNHHPDPSQPENLRDLIMAVRRQGADLGLAFDGDGDRLGVVDGGGRVVWPDRLLMLFAVDLLRRQPGAAVIYDVKCSRHLRRVIAEHGGQPMMWKTGHSLIKAAMRKTGALLAGEMSGHFFFKERWFGFDDGLYAAARLLEVLAADARSPEEVFAALPDSVTTPELRVDLAEGEQYAFIDRLLAEASFPEAEVSTIDGLRADFPDGFGLVRASNTTPCLVLRFEGDSPQALRRIQETFRKAILAVRPDLELPF
ncbi:phosphomannomutase/phosphoglucomutase [Inmirania thermothiophila]|uniref:phosphomannomutase n=1 Tax=Inmirania thermothiophila TaxID=1750597 RepID=A0A3N1Y7I7_9GAMM|nr:phosphomannomutase/phosphoglucomutase [Inmirania thermothiophila]ROR34478.1 phosphomannomutase/phosphoglucomutase [Inmirania thermothiophila]